MAKKKSSVKKTVKKTAKKIAKKKPSKKSTPVKKKVAAKKTAAPKKVSKKAASKKTATKKTKVKKTTPAKKSVASHLVKTSTAAKKLDLKGFVTPLDDRILVQLSGAEKMTVGGLYIPDTVVDTSGNLEGYVVAVGRGHMNKKGYVRPMDVKVGDRIVFSEYSGSKIKIQNEDLLILREADVLGVVGK